MTGTTVSTMARAAVFLPITPRQLSWSGRPVRRYMRVAYATVRSNASFRTLSLGASRQHSAIDPIHLSSKNQTRLIAAFGEMLHCEYSGNSGICQLP
jgi:hypothetical protein